MHRMRGIGLTDGVNVQIDINKLLTASRTGSKEHTEADIHDVLKAYYKVAIKRFNDNVVKSVVESDLLGAIGPLRIFTPEFIGGLGDDELANIAAETALTSTARTEFTARTERLTQALDMARKCGV